MDLTIKCFFCGKPSTQAVEDSKGKVTCYCEECYQTRRRGKTIEEYKKEIIGGKYG